MGFKEVEGSPGFVSPQQRRWYFGQQSPSSGEPKTNTGNRWSDIIAAARESTRVQPSIQPEELVVAINNSVDPPLTPSEEERVRKLINPEREKRLVELPEKTPKSERTPEILELIESEWARIQQQRKEQEEKKVPSKAVPIEKVKDKTTTEMGTGTDLTIPAFGQPGLYMTGSHISQKNYIHEQYPEIEDSDYWRAFQQTVQLLRSGVEFSRVKEVIDEEYPTVNVDTILKAAKGFLKKGSKDSYVDGRVYAEQFTDPTEAAAAYADLLWQEADNAFLKGFVVDLPREAKRLISKM